MVLQAEIAACHATAASFSATDWGRIVLLYDELVAALGTSIITLNRAVALAMVCGRY